MLRQPPIQTVAESLPEVTLQRRFEFAAKGFAFNQKTMSIEKEKPATADQTPPEEEPDKGPSQENIEMNKVFDEVVTFVDNTFGASRKDEKPEETTKPAPAQEQKPQNEPNAPSPEEQIAKNRTDSESFQKHQRQVSGAAQNTGEMQSAAGAQAENRQSAQDGKEKESKKNTQLAAYLAMLDNRIAAIDFQIGVGARFADDLANGKMPDLNDDGSIKDDDYEQFIKDYEDRTGTKVDRTDIDALKKAVDDQNKHLADLRKDVARDRENLDRSDPAKTVNKEKEMVTDQRGYFRDQNTGQKTGLANDTVENSEYKKNSQSAISVDEEVGQFMRSYAEIQKMDDDLGRLSAEKALMDNTSEEALENIKFSDDTTHLFAEGYFDKLSEDNPVQRAEIDVTPSPISPT